MDAHKSKRIVLISHCILNQNTVVDGLQRAPGAFPLGEILLASGAGILQLPCPEFFMMNLDRVGMSFEEYDKPEFHEIAVKLLEPVLWQVDQYHRFGYELTGLIGIQGSPNCGLKGETGVFMAELLAALSKRGFKLPLLEVPETYGMDPGQDEILHQNLMKFLEAER